MTSVIRSSPSVSNKSETSVSTLTIAYKNPPNNPSILYQMPNDLPRFPIKHLPEDFPIKDLTPLKRSEYHFDPTEPHSHSIFRFRYKLGTDHVSIHHWYCKLSYCPFHHCY